MLASRNVTLKFQHFVHQHLHTAFSDEPWLSQESQSQGIGFELTQWALKPLYMICYHIAFYRVFSSIFYPKLNKCFNRKCQSFRTLGSTTSLVWLLLSKGLGIRGNITIPTMLLNAKVRKHTSRRDSQMGTTRNNPDLFKNTPS